MIISVNRLAFELDTQKYDISKLAITESSLRHSFTIMAVDAVVSEKVCSTLCLESLKRTVNSWFFNATSEVCSCLRISNFCRTHFGREQDLGPSDPISGNISVTAAGIFIARANTRTMPGCGSSILVMQGETFYGMELPLLLHNSNELIEVESDSVLKQCNATSDKGFHQVSFFDAQPVTGAVGCLLFGHVPIICGGSYWMQYFIKSIQNYELFCFV